MTRTRPDPARTRNWMLSWTTDDLFFEGRAYWQITDRYADGFPRSFIWLPAADVTVTTAGGVTDLLEYDRRRLKAVLLEEGSLTSHMTIVARARSSGKGKP